MSTPSTSKTLSALAVIDELQEELELFPDWEGRYEHIIALGKKLWPLAEDKKQDTYLVKGCQSRVWLIPSYKDGRLHFEADSDALITRGLVAMLLRIFDQRTPDEILEVPTGDSPGSFITRLGLDQHLSQNRANGLVSMIKQIKLYAVAYKAGDDARQNGTTEQREESDPSTLRDKVIEALHTVYDPEIPVDIYELGLIYEVRTALDGGVLVVMTLTTPNCPAAQSLPADVERTVRAVEGVTDVKVQITFDPPWDRTMMSEEALFSMGLY
jgi:cysteine desulfuration protein SufE